MKLKLERTRVKIGEEFTVPDKSFDFMFGGIADDVDVMYLVMLE